MICSKVIDFGKGRGAATLIEPTTTQIRDVALSLESGDLRELSLQNMFTSMYPVFCKRIAPFVDLPEGMSFDDLSESEWRQLKEGGEALSPFFKRTADMMMMVWNMPPETLSRLLQQTVSGSQADTR
jgi:hypothetical protein